MATLPRSPIGRRSGAGGVAPLSETYSVLPSGLMARPLGLTTVMSRRDDVALRSDQENPLEIEIARLVADVAGVGDIDPSLAIDGDIVGAVEPLAIVSRSASVRTVPSRSVIETRRPPPVLAPSATIEPAAAIEDQPVGPAARLAEDRRLAALGVEPEDPVADVGEQDRAVLVQRPAFGELPFAEDLLQLRPGRDDAGGVGRRLQEGDGEAQEQECELHGV